MLRYLVRVLELLPARPAPPPHPHPGQPSTEPSMLSARLHVCRCAHSHKCRVSAADHVCQGLLELHLHLSLSHVCTNPVNWGSSVPIGHLRARAAVSTPPSPGQGQQRTEGGLRLQTEAARRGDTRVSCACQLLGVGGPYCLLRMSSEFFPLALHSPSHPFIFPAPPSPSQRFKPDEVKYPLKKKHHVF